MEKLRVTYSKSKEAIYLSHLDTLKVIQQALIRAGISVEYSKGFNPRPEITFAHPLSVGIESTGEIFDIVLTEELDPPYFIKELNKVLPSGITILSAEYVDLNEKALMSRVYAATYLITFIYPKEKLEGKNLKEIENIKAKYQRDMEKYLSQRNILVLKKSKNRMERVDVKTQIINYEFTLDGKLEITVATGSRTNLKPEFVLSGYKEFIDENIEFEIKRTRILYM